MNFSSNKNISCDGLLNKRFNSSSGCRVSIFELLKNLLFSFLFISSVSSILSCSSCKVVTGFNIILFLCFGFIIKSGIVKLNLEIFLILISIKYSSFN